MSNKRLSGMILAFNVLLILGVHWIDYPPGSPSSEIVRTYQNGYSVYLPLIRKPCLQDYQLTIPFYHLRVVVETTANETFLYFPDSTNILTMRKVGESGNSQYASLTVGVVGSGVYELWISNPSELTATVTVDIALSSRALNDILPAILSSGSAIARFYHIDNSGMTLIQQVNTNDSIAFNVDLSSLIGKPPVDGQVPVICNKEVWAIYYGWYDVPWMDWNNPRWIDRPQILYSSDDPEAISRQIDQALSAGLDGFLCEWLGPDNTTDENFQKMLDIAYRKNFKTAAYVDFSDLDYENVTEDDIVNLLSYLIPRYASLPAYAKVNGKPLIVIYRTWSISLQTWRNVFARLNALDFDATYWEEGYGSLDLMEEFDGAHIYISQADITQTYHDFGRAMFYYPLLQAGEERKTWAATAFPGFDNRPINGTTIIDRNNGELYHKNLLDALQSTAPWVFITSWNEYQETTNIEPSELYAGQYLQITRELIFRNYDLIP